MKEAVSEWQAIIGLLLTGALVGLGSLLNSQEEVTPRTVAGRAISHATLALIAGLVLLKIPDIGIVPLIALSALFASLGLDFIKAGIRKYLGIK